MIIDKELIKLWLQGSGIFWIGYTIVYLCKTFVVFEFTNPFQWVLDISSYDNMQRVNILMSYICWLIFKCMGVFLAKINKKN